MIHQPLGGAQGGQTDIDIQVRLTLFHFSVTPVYLNKYIKFFLMHWKVNCVLCLVHPYLLSVNEGSELLCEIYYQHERLRLIFPSS